MIRRLAVLLLAFAPGAAAAQSPRVDALGQPLPPDALARLGTSQFVHRGLNMNSRLEGLAFARFQGQMIFLDRGGGGAETAMRFSPDGKYFVTYTASGVRVWD